MKLENEPTIFELKKLEKELTISNDHVNFGNPFSIYLKDIGQFKLLTKEEEIELAKRIAIASESTDDKIIHLGKEARDRLIVANLRLVVSIAKKYSYFDIPLMDIIQDGTMGLIKAVDRYQVEREVKFSTYATWWIRQSISRSIANNSKTIRLPAHINETLSKVRKAMRNYANEHGKEPDLQTLSVFTGLSEVSLKLLYLYNSDVISLDQTFQNSDSTFMDLTADLTTLSPDEHDQAKILEEFIIEILKVLSNREQLIIKMRYGIESDEKTLVEIGQLLGITRERVRQLEIGAIKKLKRFMI